MASKYQMYSLNVAQPEANRKMENAETYVCVGLPMAVLVVGGDERVVPPAFDILVDVCVNVGGGVGDSEEEVVAVVDMGSDVGGDDDDDGGGEGGAGVTEFDAEDDVVSDGGGEEEG